MASPIAIHSPRSLLFVILAAAAVGAGDVRAQTADPKPPDAAVAAPDNPVAIDELTPEVLYRILVGDVAMQRGDAALAARAYFEAAKDARDPVLARRATEIALFARQRTLALEAAKLWQQLDPKAERARQMVASLAIAGAGSDLKAELQRVLIEAAANDKSLGEAFLQLNQALAAQTDKVAAFRLVQDLAKPYPKVAEAWFAIALAGYNTKLTDPAIAAAATSAADRALELKPGWDRAALIKTDILPRDRPRRRSRSSSNFSQPRPMRAPLPVALAQIYVEQKRFGDARAIFQRLWDEEPDDRELEFAVAAISVQMKDYATAQRLLEAAQQGGLRRARASCRSISRRWPRKPSTTMRRSRLPGGDRRRSCVARRSCVSRDDGEKRRRRRARAIWHALKPESAEQRIERTQTEAQLMRDMATTKSAYAMLTAGLVTQPDSVDLLYDIAMVAEKLDRLDEVEGALNR